MDASIVTLHLNHVNRHFPSGPEIPDFSLSAVLLLSADRVKPQLVMWDTCTCELLYTSQSASVQTTQTVHTFMMEISHSDFDYTDNLVQFPMLKWIKNNCWCVLQYYQLQNKCTRNITAGYSPCGFHISFIPSFSNPLINWKWMPDISLMYVLKS